ncbi:hypothetical protein Bbelb_435330 [Branchiostoma belcheri]|nr:hypothetical protein Bbelb_435330 [Branchiostoma belcheri]
MAHASVPDPAVAWVPDWVPSQFLRSRTRDNYTPTNPLSRYPKVIYSIFTVRSQAEKESLMGKGYASIAAGDARGAASRDPRSDPAILKQKCVNLMKALVPAKQRLPQRTGSFYIYEGVSGICAALGVAVACPHRRHADRLSAWWPGLKRQQPGGGKYRPAATDPSHPDLATTEEDCPAQVDEDKWARESAPTVTDAMMRSSPEFGGAEN